MKEFNDMLAFTKILVTVLLVALAACGTILSGCNESPPEETPTEEPEKATVYCPRIASWLAKKDQIIASGKPYSLIMTGWVTPEEAASLKENNPQVQIYAGLSYNWVFDNEGWMEFLVTVASYGRDTPFEIEESMYLRQGDGSRCAFGWASEEWGQEEINAMDPRNEEWVELITAFYRNVLNQPQHDGIIVDMVTEKSWCPDAISDDDWVTATKAIMARVQAINTEDKPVIFNSGRDISEIDAYSDYMDGYLMENFLGEQFGATFEEGLAAADSSYTVIYAVDTDDTGTKDMDRMRLGLTLSLLTDNTYMTYDIGGRDHGDAWWFPEYDIDLGLPLGHFYNEGSGYRRDFEKGTVICAPHGDVTVSFNEEHEDISSHQNAASFTVSKGNGRIFIK